MFDPIIAYPVSRASYIRYNWEAEHFRQIRFAMLWQGQARVSSWSQLGVLIILGMFINTLVVVGIVLAINVVWSVVMADFYEKKRLDGIPDMYRTTAFECPRSWWGWPITLFKLVVLLGIKDWLIAKIIGFLHWLCTKLPHPARRARIIVILVGLSLTGILSGHHQLTEAGFTGLNRRKWNRIGRLLNAPTQVCGTVFMGWVGFHLWLI